jgi:hypothetical protein
MEVKLRVLLLSPSLVRHETTRALSDLGSSHEPTEHCTCSDRSLDGNFSVKLIIRLHMTARSRTRGIIYAPYTGLRLTEMLNAYTYQDQSEAAACYYE